MSVRSIVPLPTAQDERVVIYCMTCQRSTSAASFVIAGLFGYIPYGCLTGRLHCKKGCGDRFGVILPIDAPTPRQFVIRYGRPPKPIMLDKAVPPAAKLNELRGALMEVDKNGTFIHTHAMADEPEILHFGFDLLLKKLNGPGDAPRRLVVTRGAQWSRDSQRDWQVIEGDKDEPIPFSQHMPDRCGDAAALSQGHRSQGPRVGGDHRAAKPPEDDAAPR